MTRRTNIVLDEKLVREGFRRTGITTRRALVDHALKELLRHERQMGLLELKGRIHWEGGLHVMRKTRIA